MNIIICFAFFVKLKIHAAFLEVGVAKLFENVNILDQNRHPESIPSVILCQNHAKPLYLETKIENSKIWDFACRKSKGVAELSVHMNILERNRPRESIPCVILCQNHA